MTTIDTTAAADLTAEFVQYPVADIKPHPQNPRRNATADPDMVASIKEHGVLQAVVLGPDGTLIMGHRRHDGSKKAKRTTIPAIVRHDLDTREKQLEVALIENIHRENLSEIEEAESFGLLKEMGYTQKTIAEKVGRSSKFVGERLKLLRLSPKTADALHAGQLTIADGIALAEFDDDPKLQEKLAKKSGLEMTRAIERAQRDRKALAAIAPQRAELEAADVPEITVKAGTRPGDLRRPDCTRLDYTNNARRSAHKKCLAFVVCPATPDGWYAPELVLVCSNPKGHKKPGPTKKELEERAKREAENEALRAAEGARVEAEHARVAALVSLVRPGVTLDPPVLDVLRVLTVDTLWALDKSVLEVAWSVLEDLVPEKARWRPAMSYDRNDADDLARQEFIDWSATQAASTMLSIHVAIAAARTSSATARLRYPHIAQIESTDAGRLRETGRRYLGFLVEAGHDLGEHGTELLDAANWTPDPPAEPEQPDNQPHPADVDPYDLIHLSDGNGLVKCRIPATSGKSLLAHREVDEVTCPDCVAQAYAATVAATGDGGSAES